MMHFVTSNRFPFALAVTALESKEEPKSASDIDAMESNVPAGADGGVSEPASVRRKTPKTTATLTMIIALVRTKFRKPLIRCAISSKYSAAIHAEPYVKSTVVSGRVLPHIFNLNQMLRLPTESPHTFPGSPFHTKP